MKPIVGVGIGVVAAAVVVGLLLMKPRGDGEATRAFTLPGYRITLPDWQGKVGTKYWFDALRLDDPTGNGRFIELRWSAGPPEPDTAIALAEQLMQAKVVAREAVDVAGKKSEVVYLEETKTPARAFAFTPFDCGDGRSAFLLTFLNQAKEPLLAAHRKALGTLTCANDPKPERAYPKVALPGWEMNEKTSGRNYTQPGQRYFFSSGVPGPAFANDFHTNGGLRQQVIAAEFGAQRVDLESLRFDGGSRAVWSGSVTKSDGQIVHVAATAFHCAGPDESFFAYHLLEQSDGGPGAADAAALMLATTACP